MKILKILIPALAALVACGKETVPAADSTFAFEDGTTAIEAPAGGAAKRQFVVRSNGSHWSFAAQNEADWQWVTIWPREGSQDGIVYITVAPSRVFTDRTAEFSITVDGRQQAFIVSQQAAVPRFAFANVTDGRVEASKEGETIKIELDTNLAFDASVSEGGDWLTVSNPTPSSFEIAAAPIPDGTIQRRATVTVSTPEMPAMSTSITVVQRNLPPLEGLPATWDLNNLKATDERGKMWIASQTILSNESAAATLRYVKGPLEGIGAPGKFDVSAGNPRTNGVGREGDSWLFAIPVKWGRANQGVVVSGAIRSSGAGSAWYYLQHSTDGTNWTTVDPAEFKIAEGVTVPHTAGIVCEDGAKNWPFRKTFTIPAEVEDGFYYVRLLVATDVTQNGTAIPSSGGSSRVVDRFVFEKM